MESLPENVRLPSKKEMEQYLDKQESEVKNMNFRALFNLEVQRARIETAKGRENYEDVQEIQAEIEKSEKALDGNEEYFEQIEKMREII